MCFSGADCTFQLERDFVVDEKIAVRSLPSVASDPMPGRRGTVEEITPIPIPRQTVTATLAGEVSGDLDRLQQAVAAVAQRVGCPACCSGFDLTLRNELNFVVDGQLNVRGVG